MRISVAVGLLALLAGCEQKLHSTKSDARAMPSVSVAPVPVPAVPPAAPEPVGRPKPPPEI
ncbi:hypothetical protein, partial [Hymenobacter daeguensis]